MRSHSEVRLPRTEETTVLSSAGDYKIWIGLPSGDPPPEGFPVLYLLDANSTFGTVLESMRMRSRRAQATGVQPAIVVGIAYPTEELFDTQRRTSDYTAGPSSEADDRPDNRKVSPSGRSDAFLQFILERVKPEVERDFPVDRTRQTLIGHSLAGFFALSVLLTRPAVFRSYIVISPSIWWDKKALFDAMEKFRAHLEGVPKRPELILCVGEYEQKLAPWQKSGPFASESLAPRQISRCMVDNSREFADRLAGLKIEGLRIEYHEVAGEDHASVILPGINYGLRFALSPA